MNACMHPCDFNFFIFVQDADSRDHFICGDHYRLSSSSSSADQQRMPMLIRLQNMFQLSFRQCTSRCWFTLIHTMQWFLLSLYYHFHVKIFLSQLLGCGFNWQATWICSVNPKTCDDYEYRRDGKVADQCGSWRDPFNNLYARIKNWCVCFSPWIMWISEAQIAPKSNVIGSMTLQETFST